MLHFDRSQSKRSFTNDRFSHRLAALSIYTPAGQFIFNGFNHLAEKSDRVHFIMKKFKMYSLYFYE